MRSAYFPITVCLSVQNTLLVAFCSLVLLTQSIFAQTEANQNSRRSLCNRENAVETIRQQIDLSRTFNNRVQRIGVLIRAADLLWPLQQDKARAVFSEAFELAGQQEKEKLEQSKGVQPSLLMETPDQRFVVIRTVARRDPALAKKMVAQIVKSDPQTQVPEPPSDSTNNVLTAQRLLTSASQMILLDLTAALDFARISLRYPASFMLARFLYELAAVNPAAADSFYEQALVVYWNRPMREFIYLATYPFAFRSSGDTPVFASYNDVVSTNFKTNRSLQRSFVQTLLRRSQQALEVPLDQGDDFNNFPGLAHIAQVLSRVEPEVSVALPEMLAELIETREKILVSLPLETQRKLRPAESTAASASKTFEEQIEQTQTLSSPEKRNQSMVSAVLSVSKKENIEIILRAIDRIDDAEIRVILKDWLYFNRTHDAIKDKRLEDAETLVSKMEMLEPRAYLRTLLARQQLHAAETQTHTREVVEQAIAEISRAPKTISAVRTLFTAADLYLKIDLNRSISVLTMAIETTNQVDGLDFQSMDQTITREIKGKGFRRLVRFYVPGPDPESALRELAKVDFDVALSQATTFADKFHRATATLGVTEICVQKVPDPPKQKPKR